MIATTPIEIAGKTYDLWSLNLAITGRYNSDRTPDASIAMRLIPTRIEADEVITADEAAIGLLRGHLNEVSDPTEQACVAAIQAALQAYLAAKGL